MSHDARALPPVSRVPGSGPDPASAPGAGTHGRQQPQPVHDAAFVERKGRKCAFAHLAALSAVWLLLLLYLALLDQGAPQQNPALVFLVVVLAVLLLMTMLRFLALVVSRPFAGEQAELVGSGPPAAAVPSGPVGIIKGTRPGDDGPAPEPTTVVCCSGGGIKSASFCLGALQQLSHHRILQGASHLVGVSGGGYMAAAFSTLAWRRRRVIGVEGVRPADSPKDCDGDPGPFASGSDELNRLRRSTKYLASSPEVRFELIASLLLGIMSNLVLLGCLSVVLAWLTATYAVSSGLLVVPDDGDWAWNPGGHQPLPLLALPSLFLFGVAFVWFLLARRNPAPWSGEGRNGERARAGPATFSQRRSTWETSEGWQFAVGNLGARASQMALFFFPLFPGVLWLAYQLEGRTQSWTGPDLGTFQVTLAGLVTTLTAFLGLLNAARTGLRQDVLSAGQQGFLTWFRRQAAPVLAIIVFLVGLYGSLVLFTLLALRDSWILGTHGWVFVFVPLLIAVLFKVNDTSIFQFYRDRLDAAYLSYQPDGGKPEPFTTPTLAEVNADASPGVWPKLMLLGTANVRDPDLLPADRHGTPFVLSDTVGISDPRLPGGTALLDAKAYSYDLDVKWKARASRQLTVAMAVAMSGAAVAPIAGRDDRVLGRYRLLLALANIRLGLWVRNPYWVANDARRQRGTEGLRWARWVLRVNDYLDNFAPSLLFHEAIGLPRIIMPFLYVTDGGHYDNLGLVEALRTKPRRIIMLDGSGDPEDGFPTMANAIATARMDQQVEIAFDPRRLRRGARQYPRSGWTVCTATYPDGSTCDIVYIKALLPKGQPWDLQSYRTRNPGFPSTTMEYELFDEFTFEAYRELGCSLVRQAMTELAWCKAPTSTTCQDESHG